VRLVSAVLAQSPARDARNEKKRNGNAISCGAEQLFASPGRSRHRVSRKTRGVSRKTRSMADCGIEHYKRMAEQCERKAEALPDTEEKKFLKELARQWRELAKRAERAGEQPSNKPRG
jgi:hypothetical protein